MYLKPMVVSIVWSTLCTSLAAQSVTLEYCKEYDADVAIRPQEGYLLCHFHLLFEDLPNKKCYARVRYGQDLESMVESAVTPTTARESWSFYFRIPTHATGTPYLIEAGTKGLTQSGDEYIIDNVLTSGGWKMNERRQVEPDEQIASPVNFIKSDSGSIRIESTHPHRCVGCADIEYKVVPNLGGQNVVDGVRSSRRYVQP